MNAFIRCNSTCKKHIIYIARQLNQTFIRELSCCIFLIVAFILVSPWSSPPLWASMFSSLLLERPGWSFREFLLQRGIMLGTSGVCVCMHVQYRLFDGKRGGWAGGPSMFMCVGEGRLCVKTFSDD